MDAHGPTLVHGAIPDGFAVFSLLADARAAPRRHIRPQLDAYGGYYTLGRLFVKCIGHPDVMKLLTRRGLPHPTLMRFTLKLLANLTDPRGGDAMDRLVNALTRLAPAA